MTKPKQNPGAQGFRRSPPKLDSASQVPHRLIDRRYRGAGHRPRTVKTGMVYLPHFT
jgi:hypothetical protein